MGARRAGSSGDRLRRGALLDLSSMGGAVAGNLRALCKPDDRVAIAMTNRPEFLEALFAIWHAGLVAVPMNAKLHSDEFRLHHRQHGSGTDARKPGSGGRCRAP